MRLVKITGLARKSKKYNWFDFLKVKPPKGLRSRYVYYTV